MIRLMLFTFAWCVSLMLACALTLAPIMHGLMVLIGRESADLFSLIGGPVMFVAGLCMFRVFGRIHEAEW